MENAHPKSQHLILEEHTWIATVQIYRVEVEVFTVFTCKILLVVSHLTPCSFVHSFYESMENTHPKSQHLILEEHT